MNMEELKSKLAGIAKRTALENNLSMASFGEAIGVSRQTIYNWQNASVMPDIERLLYLRSNYSDWRSDMADKMLTVIAAELLA